MMSSSNREAHEDIAITTETYHENDVLMGRGGKNNQHVGNEKLRVLARERAEKYRLSSKKGKSYISRELVQLVRQMSPPGRFLKRDVESDMWEDVGDEVAREKASQALRDAVSGLPASPANVSQTEEVAQQLQHQHQLESHHQEEEHQLMPQPLHLQHEPQPIPFERHYYRHPHEESRSRAEQYHHEQIVEPSPYPHPPHRTHASHPYQAVTPASPSTANKRRRYYEQSTPYQHHYHHHYYHEHHPRYQHEINRQYQHQRQHQHLTAPSSPIPYGSDPYARPYSAYPTYRPSSHPPYPVHNNTFPPRPQTSRSRSATVDSPGGIFSEINATDFDLFNGELLTEEEKEPLPHTRAPPRREGPPTDSPPDTTRSSSSYGGVQRNERHSRRQQQGLLPDSPSSHGVAWHGDPDSNSPNSRQSFRPPHNDKG